MIGNWTLVTPPVGEPVTLEKLRAHLRIDDDDDDDLLMLYAQGARQAVEEETWRAILPQTWDLFLDGWPADGVIELPKPPLQSVTSITYRNSDDVTATLAASVYEVDIASEPGRVTLAYGQSWPTTTLAAHHAIRVRFVAGYADAASVPSTLRMAILLQAGDSYLYREAVTEKGVTLTPAVDRLMRLYRVRW